MAAKINAFHKIKNKVTEKVRNTNSVISRLLVKIERSDWSQNFLCGTIYYIVKVRRQYMCSVGQTVGSEKLKCPQDMNICELHIMVEACSLLSAPL